jgi:hypothetical protein
MREEKRGKEPKNMNLGEIAQEIIKIKSQCSANENSYERYQRLCKEIDDREVYKFKF